MTSLEVLKEKGLTDDQNVVIRSDDKGLRFVTKEGSEYRIGV